MVKPKNKGPRVTGNRTMDISILLKMVLDKNHISENIYLKTLQERFDEIVGKSLAPYVKIENLKDKVLVLKIANAVVKNEIFMEKNAIIQKCNELCNAQVITTLILR